MLQATDLTTRRGKRCVASVPQSTKRGGTARRARCRLKLPPTPLATAWGLLRCRCGLWWLTSLLPGVDPGLLSTTRRRMGLPKAARLTDKSNEGGMPMPGPKDCVMKGLGAESAVWGSGKRSSRSWRVSVTRTADCESAADPHAPKHPRGRGVLRRRHQPHRCLTSALRGLDTTRLPPPWWARQHPQPAPVACTQRLHQRPAPTPVPPSPLACTQPQPDTFARADHDGPRRNNVDGAGQVARTDPTSYADPPRFHHPPRSSPSNG